MILLLAVAGLLPSCAEQGLDPSAMGRRDPVASYGTWKPALSAVPHTISDADVALYRQIYALQAQEQWSAADKLIAQLKDRSLLGHVLSARYLGGYQASYSELEAWLKKYSDEPDNKRIAQLAALKRPRVARPRYRRTHRHHRSHGHHVRYEHRRHAEAQPADDGVDDMVATTSSRPRPRPTYRRHARLHHYQASASALYRLELKRGNLENAARVLETPAAEREMGAARIDGYKAELSVYFLQSAKFDRAYALASAAAARSNGRVPEAAWVAGLAGFKIGKFHDAAGDFESVASTRRGDEWSEARAAYWAARAHQAAGETDAARTWLERAATRGRTLYGMLARQRLGQRQDFNFGVAMAPSDTDLADIAASPEGKRAFGLVQIGVKHGAGEELLRRYRDQGGKESETYIAIADRAALPDLAYYVSAQLYTRTGRMYDPGLYPVPDWTPRGGFHLDRALIFGVMRQESAFQPKVVSRANARGLMQLIPHTASVMAGDASLRNELGRLYDPAFNMELGQRYLRRLLQNSDINGNVALAAAAYNAGEGAVVKWTLRDDPLLFLATIPYGETRGYVEHVLYNITAYRLRFGQHPVELEELAANRWPIYRAQEQ
jgi:soluble lytic murein transglycosylase-like protein